MKWLIFLLIMPGVLYILDVLIDHLTGGKEYIEIRNVKYPGLNKKTYYGVRKEDYDGQHGGS